MTLDSAAGQNFRHPEVASELFCDPAGPADEAEELQDIAAFDAAMAEGGPAIPWDELELTLGWA